MTTRLTDRIRGQRRGAAAVLAMLFLVLFTTLAVAMYGMSSLNVQGADTLRDSVRARDAAESGLRWMSWRFVKMNRPKTPVGNITSTVADGLWPTIRQSIKDDLALMQTSTERATTWDGVSLTTAPVATDTAGTNFVVSVRQHPVYVGDPLDKRYLRVTSTGTYGSATKSVSMDFKIDKKVKYAIVGKVPIQIGRNTLVEGPIAMTTAGKYPPILQLSDFRHLSTSLQNKIDQFNTFLENNHKGYDNRVSVNNPDELAKATAAGYTDVNNDKFIDEYDLFVKEFDTDGDGAITKAEFTNPVTGKLYDADLFKAMDMLGMPLSPTDPLRVGLTRLPDGTIVTDDKIDNNDAYSKIRGQISIASTASGWTANLAPSGQTIQDMIQGPIQTDNGAVDPAVKFGVDSTDFGFDLTPTNFDTTSFKAQTSTDNGTTAITTAAGVTTIENKTLSAADASYGPQTIQVTTPGGTTFKAGDVVLKSAFDAANAPLPSAQKATAALPVGKANERTPLGSGSYQATYQRPVFKNIKFKNVRIPKGMNALFDGCTFEGVTFVELTTNITKPSGATTTDPNDGSTWSKKMKSGTFTADTVLTTTNSQGFDAGNNLRFNNCTINGPLASDVPTAYTHFTNSMEFTGATMFDNKWIDPQSGQTTATMVLPQTNIEMGSFTDPSKAPSTLQGVVVAGNLDIRGASIVDGSIIITGDGAGNTTQGWFGPRDDATDATTPMPEGGYGRLNIRYNPNRALPNGINVAVDILPDNNTYSEGQ